MAEQPETMSRRRLATIAGDPKHPMHTHAVSMLSRMDRTEATSRLDRVRGMINKEKQRDAAKHDKMVTRAKVADIRSKI